MISLLRELIEHAEDFSEPTVTTSTFDETDWLPSDFITAALS
jgi:hypothetical protein